MKLHALVEGPSEKAFLDLWAPRFLKGHEVRVYPHQGKGKLPGDPRLRGLLDQLEAKLRAYGACLDPKNERVLVLVDADDDDVAALRDRIKAIVASIDPPPMVLVRFAVEELEAFYLADLRAVARAFPDFDRGLARDYQPDSICGTWEYFGQVVGDGGGNKVAWAEAMGGLLTVNPGTSRSQSFKKLCNGLRKFVEPPPVPSQRKKKPRRSKTAVPRDGTGKRKW